MNQSNDPAPSHQPTVVVVGASRDRAKYGNRSVRAHAAEGYRVFPINPHAGRVQLMTIQTPGVSKTPGV